MLRKGLLLWAALLLVPVLASAYTVVLKDGRKIETPARYVIEGNLVKFTGTDGRAYEVPAAQVDWLATRRANERLAPKVWTNEDLARLGGDISVVGGSRPAAAAAGGEGEAAGEEESKPEPPKETTVEYWQERLAPLRAELAQVEQQLNQLRSNQGRAASNTLDLNTDAAGVDVQDTIRRLEERRRQLQQQIEDIQLEAKRKGIAPGRLR